MDRELVLGKVKCITLSFHANEKPSKCAVTTFNNLDKTMMMEYFEKRLTLESSKHWKEKP